MSIHTVKQLETNLILMVDSYKLGHGLMYPKNTCGMFGYIEARSKGDLIIPAGAKMFINKYLTMRVTHEDIEEAEAFAAAHGEPFDREMWEIVVDKHNGFLPIVIKTLPEGTPVQSGNIILSVHSENERVWPIVSSIETILQRAIWYPTTIASNDHKVYKLLRKALEQTSDNLAAINFMYHSFAGRGVSSHESAEIGDYAHTIHFMGSDTVEGVRSANFYYNTPMSAYSVVASEHSVATSYGPSEEQQALYLKAMLDLFAKPGAIVSIVIDAYDMMREATQLCTTFKQQIINSGAKIVFRPDSGDAIVNVVKLLKLQAEHFGFTVNSKGYKVVNNVAVIQGDGVDYRTMELIIHAVELNGFSIENVVFGSGGALLQKVCRDDYKFAQKASAIKIKNDDGTFEWRPIFKDPVTDPGKTSKKGILALEKDGKVHKTINLIDPSADPTNELKTAYDHGKVYDITGTLDNVRARAMTAFE
jgi:nicotinamide phosphoribosyltransferase